jgi:hypothetical protein
MWENAMTYLMARQNWNDKNAEKNEATKEKRKIK